MKCSTCCHKYLSSTLDPRLLPFYCLSSTGHRSRWWNIPQGWSAIEQGHIKNTFFLAGLFNNGSLQVKAHIHNVLQPCEKNTTATLSHLFAGSHLSNCSPDQGLTAGSRAPQPLPLIDYYLVKRSLWCAHPPAVCDGNKWRQRNSFQSGRRNRWKEEEQNIRGTGSERVVLVKWMSEDEEQMQDLTLNWNKLTSLVSL